MNQLLINLVIILVFFWLHSLTEAIRDCRTRRNNSVLSRLGYDPDRHDLVVTLSGGSRLTGKADVRSDPFQDGVLLRDAREAGGETLPGRVTFIPAHSIIGLAVRDRTDK